jgi:hypothetical protein
MSKNGPVKAGSTRCGYGPAGGVGAGAELALVDCGCGGVAGSLGGGVVLFGGSLAAGVVVVGVGLLLAPALPGLVVVSVLVVLVEGSVAGVALLPVAGVGCCS